ncbi:hypothetical protein BDZ89DRAFT_1064317 [Hymenopellis radicata]|nr:hypothetical protein BDZ89DRAFT_1064317 [Hymenopellis radicata]
MSTSSTKIAFISGPLEPDQAYFATHYIPLLQTALAQNHHFVLGAARGIDSLARRYLLHEARIPASHITVFLSSHEAARLRPKLASFETAGGLLAIAGKNHTARDAEMTKASHYDILRYRTDAECRALYGSAYRKRISGTERNELRRLQGAGLIWQEAMPALDA